MSFNIKVIMYVSDDFGFMKEILQMYLQKIYKSKLICFTQGVYLDLIGDGMQFSNMHVGQFPLSASITMLAVDTVLYGLIAVYLDNVLPSIYSLIL